MFNNDADPEYAFQALYIDKLLVDHGYPATDNCLDQESYHEAFFDALDLLAKKPVRNTFFDDNDGTGYERWDFYDPCITDYFELSNEYSKRHHIRYKKNPYINRVVGGVKKEHG